MTKSSFAVPFLACAFGGVLVACSSSSGAPAPTPDSGVPIEGGPQDSSPDTVTAGDTGTDAGVDSGVPVPPTASNIKHVVVVVQENHSFDAYFGHYCTAMTGSNPTCNTGPSCCEAAPATDPGTGDMPVDLNDAENAGYDPNHLQACELAEIDNGKMDMYVTAPPAGCGSTKNFAIADSTTAAPYWDLAGKYAIADHYFQPIAGQSSSNDMYLARAAYVFTDNTDTPDSIGGNCVLSPTKSSFTDQTIGDLLVAAAIPWGWYGEGYQAALDAHAMMKCATAAAGCPAGFNLYPCVYDPSDVPFAYYPSLRDNPKYMFDYASFAKDVAASALPAVSYVKGYGYRTEHPGYGTVISTGASFIGEVTNAIQQSTYASDTLVLVTYDESGGFFDHVAPPPTSAVDQKPYGPRIPFFAIGTFAKKNFVSHVQMEHSSIVKFIEWNWLGMKTGQLGTRDMAVNNIGSMLDPAATGTQVPD